jgi:hypothetical protein
MKAMGSYPIAFFINIFIINNISWPSDSIAHAFGIAVTVGPYLSKREMVDPGTPTEPDKPFKPMGRNAGFLEKSQGFLEK